MITINPQNLRGPIKEALELFSECEDACGCMQPSGGNDDTSDRYLGLPIVLLTEGDVARILSQSPYTLQKHRYLKKHDLPYVKLDQRVYYRFCDVVKYINDNLVPANDR